MDQPIGRAVHHVLSDVSGGEDDFRRWSERHHHEMLRRRGYLSMRRFEIVSEYAFATPGGPRHLTVYEIDDEAAADDSGTAGEDPMPPSVTGLTFTRTIYRQLAPASGAFTASGVDMRGTQPIGAALLNVMIKVDPDHDAEYNAWYDEEHLPALVAVPGVLAARRFTAASTDAPYRYLSLYQLEDPTVASTDGFARAGAPSPRSQALTPYRSTSFGLYRQVFPQAGPLLPT